MDCNSTDSDRPLFVPVYDRDVEEDDDMKMEFSPRAIAGACTLRLRRVITPLIGACGTSWRGDSGGSDSVEEFE